MNIKLDENNDIVSENNNLAFVDGLDEIDQLAKIKLTTFLGEWFLDTGLGVPYFQTIMAKATNPAIIDNIFLDKIASLPGVINVNSFSTSLDKVTRELSVQFEAVTTEGILNFDEVVA